VELALAPSAIKINFKVMVMGLWDTGARVGK
jgi:hypothetical protein